MNDNSRYPGRGRPGLRLSGRAALPLLLAAVALVALGQASGAQTLPTLYSFTGGSDGANPTGDLIQAADGNFYGMTLFGGANGEGTVFEIPNTGTLSAPVWGAEIVLHTFAFMSTNGALPVGSLIQGRDGSLYGITEGGGANGEGTVFEIPNTGTPSAPVWGAFTLLHSFTGGSDGAEPQGSLIQASDGNLYGMAAWGGANGYGTIFKIPNAGTPSAPSWGILALVHSFGGTATDGANPLGSLIQASDGKLYGMTQNGGANNLGMVFEIALPTPTVPFPTLNTLYSFTGGSDGEYPTGSLIQAGDGSLYGMTQNGGANADGTVFKISNTGTASSPIWGTETVLHSFAAGTSDGAIPYGSLIQASDGSLNGMTEDGGSSGYGTVFQLTTSGTLTLLHSFAGGSTDGTNPYGSLIQAGDGNLYGMTRYGGAYNAGTVFVCKVSLGAQLTPAPAATGWCNASTGIPTLTLIGDETASITYTVTTNGAAGSPVTVPGANATITFPGDGVYSISYSGIDIFGNPISTYTTPVNIDTVPPVTYLYDADSLVFLDGTDTTSGVAASYYTVDGGAQQTYVDEIQLPQDNQTHTITYWSVDVAGNVEAANTATIDTRTTTFVLANDVPGTSSILRTTTFSATLGQTDTDLPIAGQTLTFTLSNGTSLGTAVTNSSGLATLTIILPLSAPAGSYTFTAAFAGNGTLRPASDTGSVTIAAVATTVSASSRGSAGSPIPVGTAIPQLKAELTAVGGNIPLSGCTINYQMNGTSIGSAAVQGNIASISYTLPDTLPMGANTLTVSFAGQGSLSASTGTATYYIGPANTTLTPVYWAAKAGTLVALSATLTSQITHQGLAGKTVTFTVKGQTYTATTAANGAATVFYTLPGTKQNFTYTASFAGTTAYNPVSNVGYITVTN